MFNPLKIIPGGPLARIILRYGIGYAAGRGIIPDGLAQMITDSDEALTAIETGIGLGAALCVERVYLLARKRGWAL